MNLDATIKFMHSLWINISLYEEDDKVKEMGNVLMKDFCSNADRLLSKVMAMNK